MKIDGSCIILVFIILFNTVFCFETYFDVPCEQKCSLNIEQSLINFPVYQGEETHRRVKRAAGNLRIHAHYDTSFETQKQSFLYKEYIIGPAIGYMQKALRVRNPYSNLKLQRKCRTNHLAFVNINDVFSYFCVDGCAPQTLCGDVVVPDAHLMACRRVVQSSLQMVGPDGPGVENADYILYIESRSTAKCRDPSVLAYASSCQSEAELDRPIAGSINFCPGRLSNEFGHLSQSLFIAKHELIHALGFAVTQFAFYRNPLGQPYTQRNRLTGRPDLGFLGGSLTVRSYDRRQQQQQQQQSGSTAIFRWSGAVTRSSIRQWASAAGLFLKNSTLMVLPTVVAEARRYFNCSSLLGLELEDQGGLGVALTHWEKRILENDIMTATFTQEARVSRITLALLYDTGWYLPNYEMADEMNWGRNLGCDFVELSCYAYMMQQLRRGQSIRPFCDVVNAASAVSQRQRQLELAGFCSEDRHAYGYCNLERHPHPLPLQHRYFTDDQLPDSAFYGGKSVVANYCPYPQEFNWYKGSKVSRTTQCKEERNNQGNRKNFLLQSFGPTSSCFSLSRRWTVNYCGKESVPNILGAGCYQYFCSANLGLVVVINNQSYQCPSAGDIVAIDDYNGHFFINGALICPSCPDLCPISNCQDNVKLRPFLRTNQGHIASRQTQILQSSLQQSLCSDSNRLRPFIFLFLVCFFSATFNSH